MLKEQNEKNSERFAAPAGRSRTQIDAQRTKNIVILHISEEQGGL